MYICITRSLWIIAMFTASRAYPRSVTKKKRQSNRSSSKQCLIYEIGCLEYPVCIPKKRSSCMFEYLNRKQTVCCCCLLMFTCTIQESLAKMVYKFERQQTRDLPSPRHQRLFCCRPFQCGNLWYLCAFCLCCKRHSKFV